MPFTLPDLPYPQDALEPVIDARTMEIHHGKHHNAYVTRLNAACAGTPLESSTLEQLLGNLGRAPEARRTAIRNNGGGTYNHNLFWTIMAPPGKDAKPRGDLARAIDRDLGGFDNFKQDFSTAAAGRFGSGWAWLIVKSDGKLAITDTKNQDNPLMIAAAGFEGDNGTPILCLDVWEHAYYLHYQNRRPDYIKAWFDVINWPQVARNFDAAG